MGFIAPIAGGLLGGLLGGLGNSAGARTGTQSSTSSTSGTSTPTYSPLQTQMQGDLYSALSSYLKNPTAMVTPMLTQGASNLDTAAAGENASLAKSLAARGFGNSGTQMLNTEGIESNRVNSISSLLSSLYGNALNNYDKVLSLSSGFGFANPGSQTQSTTTSKGQYTVPGSTSAGILGGGLEGMLGLSDALGSLFGGGGN
jgi:hypothetical protein